jgi:hypothetical protein
VTSVVAPVVGDEAAALGLAVAKHPGPIRPDALLGMLASVEAACASLADARRELPGAGGPEAAGAAEDAT